MDSSASRHIALDQKKINQFTNVDSSSSEVKSGGGESHVIQGTGTSIVQIDSSVIKLTKVKYVLSMTKNLISWDPSPIKRILLYLIKKIVGS